MNRKDRVETLKAIEEIRVLRRQSTKQAIFFSNLGKLASVSGLVTAFVALGGLIYSFYSFQAQQEADRQASRLTEINAAIQKLSHESEAVRVTAVAGLNSFLQSGETET